MPPVAGKVLTVSGTAIASSVVVDDQFHPQAGRPFGA